MPRQEWAFVCSVANARRSRAVRVVWHNTAVKVIKKIIGWLEDTNIRVLNGAWLEKAVVMFLLLVVVVGERC